MKPLVPLPSLGAGPLRGGPVPGFIFRKGLSILACAVALALPAAAQTVKDLVEVEGARPNKLRGYGVVTGLNGAGDSPSGESARLLKAMLQNLVAPEAAIERIEARGAAVVVVSAELRPFQKAGTRLDVTVSTVGDAKSLVGGELQLTDLRGPQGRAGPVHALASGRLVIQGGARRGSSTTAYVPGGAIVERELEHRFVGEVPVREGDREVKRKGFKLLLRHPDFTISSQLAFQINASAVRGVRGRLDVATALDGGSVLVRIPTPNEYRDVTGSAPEVDYEAEPVRWLEVILNLPFLMLAPEAAAVVVNDVAKTVSWTGPVKLRSGSVMLAAQGARPTVLRTREDQALSDFLAGVADVLTEQQQIDVVKALHQAGLLMAELKSQ